MSQITATARALSRALSRATRAAQAGKAIYARAWFREPGSMTNWVMRHPLGNSYNLCTGFEDQLKTLNGLEIWND